MNTSPLDIALGYHHGWTTGDFDTAEELLADDLTIEVPLNEYAGKADFSAALRSFGGAATEVRVLGALEGKQSDACVIYDMDVAGLGTLRVAEHFRIVDGRIAAVRQIHDTAALRKAGFGPPL